MSVRSFTVLEECLPRPETRAAVREQLGLRARQLGSRLAGLREAELLESAEDGSLLLRLDFASAEAACAYLEGPLARALARELEPLLARHRRRRLRPLETSRTEIKRVLVAVPILARRRELLRPLEEAGFTLSFNELDRNLSEEELISRLEGVVATIASMEPYTERVFAAAPGLRIIARFGVGYDAIDLDAATRRGVAVVMAFGANHEAVADHAFALMAALAQQIAVYDRDLRRGAWRRHAHVGLYGRTVGIVGFGRIGRALAKRCKAFAMRILVSDPALDAETVAHLGCELVPLERLLAEAEFVSLHLPLTPETERFLDARRLSLMRPGSYLINTARGGLVDEQALVRALEEGRIAGAGLDVFAVEPLRDSPLLGMENVVLTPHVAGLSDDSIRRMAAVCAENILRLWRGEAPGEGRLLNPEVLAGNRWSVA